MDEKTGSLDGFARAQMRWTLNRTPLDDAERAEVVDGIRRCHEAVDLPWHGVVVWVPSPLAGLMAAAAATRCLTPPYQWQGRGATTRSPAVARVLRAAAERVPVAPLCAVAVLLVAVTAAALAGPAVRAAPALVHSFNWSLLVNLYFISLPTVFLLYYLRDLWDASPGVVHTAAGETAVSLAWRCGMTLLGLTTTSVGAAVGLWRSDADVDMAAVAGYVTLTAFAAAMALSGALLDGWQWRRWWRRRWEEKPAPERTVPFPQIAQARAEAERQLRGRVDPLKALSIREALIPVTSLERPFSTVIWQQAATTRQRAAARAAAVRAVHELVERVTGRRARRVAVPAKSLAGRPSWFPGQFGRGELAGLLWDAEHGRSSKLVEALDQANRAGWWWAEAGFVVVCERPVEIHGEWAGAEYRLHRDDGPAVRWRDGFALNFWHGTPVPADFFDTEPSVRAINRMRNSELRRATIERIGWAAYVERAGWRRVATAPDPGNPPHELILYEDPQHRDGRVRVLVMTNGSPDRSGEQRRYAELVPDHLDDPVEAAAWQYGCPVEVYQRLQRRT